MPSFSRYLAPSEDVAATGLALDGVGWISGQTRRTAARRATYAGLLLTSGRGTLELDGHPTPYPVRPGSFWWLPPGLPHSYGPDPDGWSEHWILFHGPATTPYEALGLLAGGPPVVDVSDPTDLLRCLQRLRTAADRPDSLSRDLAAGAELHRLVQLVHHTVPVAHGPGQAAVDHLTANAYSPVSIRNLAANLNISQDTLVTEVRRLTGSTPTDFLIRRRLAHAKELLAATTLPVSQISHRVGYQDPGYFTRLFTERVGATPTAFRRAERS